MTQAAHPPGEGGDQRVSVIAGDRLCAGCGFNLVGQTIVRERHYGLLIARCPECSRVAALLEYPLLGRWANRWAALLAAIWLLVVVALGVATAGLLTGLGQATASLASRTYASAIAREHAAWFAGVDETTRAKYQQWQGVAVDNGPYTMVFTDWWETVDEAALFRRAGGWTANMRWQALGMWVWVVMVGVIAGGVLAVGMAGAKRQRLLLVMLGPVLLACAFSAPIYLGESTGWNWGGGTYAIHLAERTIGPVAAYATIAFGLPCLWIGAMVGRPVARGLVRVMLPPRLRGPLATLWITDGLAPPAP